MLEQFNPRDLKIYSKWGWVRAAFFALDIDESEVADQYPKKMARVKATELTRKSNIPSDQLLEVLNDSFGVDLQFEYFDILVDRALSVIHKNTRSSMLVPYQHSLPSSEPRNVVEDFMAKEIPELADHLTNNFGEHQDIYQQVINEGIKGGARGFLGFMQGPRTPGYYLDVFERSELPRSAIQDLTKVDTFYLPTRYPGVAISYAFGDLPRIEMRVNPV